MHFPTRKDADYRVLVEIIRTELSPLKTDLANVKQTVDEVRAAQRSMYTQREIDLMLKERDDRISVIDTSLSELKRTVGSLWQQTAVKVSAFVGLGIGVLELLRQLRGL